MGLSHFCTLTLHPGRSGTARTARPAHSSISKNIVMEFLNRIQLRGVVGKAEVITFSSQNQVCNFSVVTDYSTVDREGNSIIESTWFNVSAWHGRDGVDDIYALQKGVWVEVTGRLRNRKYTTQNGEERYTTEIVARKVKLVPREEEPMQPQRDW